MKAEIKCKRILVNINAIEIRALTDLYYSMQRHRKCARSAVFKVIDAWSKANHRLALDDEARRATA